MSNRDRGSKESRSPDAFLRTSGDIVKALRPYSRQIFSASVILLIVAIGLAALNIHQAQLETKAQELYVHSEKAYNKAVDDIQNAPTKIKSIETQIQNLKKDKKNKAENDKKIADLQKQIEQVKYKQGSGDFEKDYGKIVSGFKSVISEYPKTQAAILASMYLAQIYAENKKVSDAITVLSNPELNFREGQLLYGLAQMKLGQLFELSGDCQKSINTWQKVLSYRDLSYFHPEASLSTAVCYETLKNYDKAQEFYKKTHSDFKDSSAGAAAQKYLRLGTMNKKDS